MTAIDHRTEQLIEETVRRATCIQIDGCTVYLASYQGNKYLRYMEGAKRITFTSRTEKPKHISYAKLLLNAVSGLYPRIYVVENETPLSWDTESASLSDDHQQIVLDRVKRAVLKKYSGYRFDVFSGSTLR